jgi:UDP-N-acetylmuramate--alanine ligase
MGTYHLVGVAGVGMSALAQLLAAQGHAVTGSDRYLDRGDSLDVLDRLRAAGVELTAQDGSAVTEPAQVMVVSTAIEEDNPDLVAARAIGCRVAHRAEVLAACAAEGHCLAVTGTSGKTTVTGMLGWVLEQAGRDPTVVDGGAVKGWVARDRVGNVRVGASDLWVVEADESDRSLLRFYPEGAVITNISLDHFEMEEVVELFGAFAGQVKEWVVCGRGVRAQLPGSVKARLVDEPDDCALKPGRFSYKGRSFELPMLGRHNIENALVTVMACEELGLDLEAVAEALSRFPGIQRRLDVVGRARGVTVIDDYAHNPAKMAASWRAVADTAPRVLGVWRPHGFGPLALMAEELVDTLKGLLRPVDRFYVLPVYYVGGTARQTLDARAFTTLLQDAGVAAVYVEDYESLEASLCSEARDGDAVLCMGARDPDLPRFAAKLVAGLREEPRHPHR